MWAKHKQAGFTIVELLIVIVVIAILAAITIVAYGGIQDRAKYTREQSDMSGLNKLINLYYVSNGQYPSNSMVWSGWGQATNFIPGIVPTFAPKVPQMPNDPDTNNSYLYISDGSNYKLIRYSGSVGLPSVERTNNALADPVRNLSVGGGAWGYWSSGGVGW